MSVKYTNKKQNLEIFLKTYILADKPQATTVAHIRKIQKMSL